MDHVPRRHIALITVLLCCIAAPLWGKSRPKEADTPALSLDNAPSIEWVVKLKKRGGIGRGLLQFSAPLIVGERVYVGGAGGRFYAVDREHGDVLWNVDTDGPVVGAAREFGGQLYVGDGKGILYALNAENGATLWRIELGSEIMAAPLVTDPVIYVATMASDLIAIDRATGARKWRSPRRLVAAPFTVKGCSSPILIDRRVIVGFPDGTVAAHDAASGAVVWEQRLASSAAILQDVDTTPLPMGHLVLVGTIEQLIVGIESRTGRIVWKADGGTPNELVVGGGVVYSSGNGKLTALDAASGAVRWKVRLPVGETSTPLVVGEKLLLLTPADQIYLVNRTDGTVLGKRHLGTGSYGHPVGMGDRAYLVTNGGNLVALRIP